MESGSLDNNHLLPAPLKESSPRQKLGFVVGIFGNIISVLVFLSPIDTFWRILNNKSTEDFDSIPYICTLLNTSLWIYYGLTAPNSILVATVNGFGFVVEAVYIIIFVIFAVNYIRIQIAVLVGIEVVFFLAVFFGTSARRMQRDQRVRVIGAISAVVNILMYSSPLAAMRTVVITGSVEYMPFFLSFFLLLNGGVWAFYALLFRDLWVGIPNGIGFVLGAAQIVIYNIFKLRVLKEGGQHEQFL